MSPHYLITFRIIKKPFTVGLSGQLMGIIMEKQLYACRNHLRRLLAMQRILKQLVYMQRIYMAQIGDLILILTNIAGVAINDRRPAGTTNII